MFFKFQLLVTLFYIEYRLQENPFWGLSWVVPEMVYGYTIYCFGRSVAGPFAEWPGHPGRMGVKFAGEV